MVGDITPKIEELQEYAKIHRVPIMVEEGMEFLLSFINEKGITSILEVGTAIGYSAIRMALLSPNITITSIERDEERYLEAVKNVKKFHLEDRITLLFQDALEVQLNQSFDLIFLDAAKAQNIKFFELFTKNLKDHGFVITDNMDFHGLVAEQKEEELSHNLRGIVRKLRAYHEYLEQLTSYRTSFYSIGDGVAVTEKL